MKTGLRRRSRQASDHRLLGFSCWCPRAARCPLQGGALARGEVHGAARAGRGDGALPLVRRRLLRHSGSSGSSTA